MIALGSERALEREAPALWAALSPLGWRLASGVGEAAAEGGAGAGAPALGLPALRRRWRGWQRREGPAAVSTLPCTTVGLSHALSLVADLFAGPGRAVAVPQPFWGNYRQCFEMRNGARLLTAPAYRGGRFNPHAWSEALAGVPAGEPAVAIVNIPSNPGGYSPAPAERQVMLDALVEEAGRRPLLALCDDAYAGLVFEPGIPAASPFWDLAGAHPNLVAVKVDGATKEFSFFGGRVGFLTFALEPEGEGARALEAMVDRLAAATMGAPAAAPQEVLLAALRQEGIERQVETVRALLAGRYRALRDALAAADPNLLHALPFNSGCFALVELPEGLKADVHAVRRHLLDHWDTGVISLEPRYLRIAHCSVDEAALPELVRRLEGGVGELVG